MRKADNNILVIDVGGSHIKCLWSGSKRPRQFESGDKITPAEMVAGILKIVEGWHFDAISIGYPGVVRDNAPLKDPHNLGPGWVGFNFEKAFSRPVKIINDAAMQALGAYNGSKMLFLGLGTGLGSALIVDGIIEPMELGHLRYKHGKTYEDYLGEAGRKRLGTKKWRREVFHVAEGFREALLPDYIVFGGGNIHHLKNLPPNTLRGANSDAFTGGFRLWEEQTEATKPRSNIGLSRKRARKHSVTTQR